MAIVPRRDNVPLRPRVLDFTERYVSHGRMMNRGIIGTMQTVDVDDRA